MKQVLAAPKKNVWGRCEKKRTSHREKWDMRFSEMAYPFSQKGTCVFRCFLITEQEKQKVENRKFEGLTFRDRSHLARPKIKIVYTREYAL